MVDEALKLAVFYRERVKHMGRDERISAAWELASYEVFSSRQLGAILDIDWWTARTKNEKTGRTGGAFNADSLADLRDAAEAYERGEVDPVQVARILDAGTSRRMVTRLTGIPESTVQRCKARAERILGEGER